jgi:microcin C transport system substrate-binding protein
VENSNPTGFQGFAMNLRREKFQDRRVRKALAHLLDRKRMNATLMFNQYALTASYYPDLYPEGNPNDVIPFDVDAARALLTEAGWRVNDNGQLEKDGKPFVINFLTRSATADRFLLIYREALEEVGIQLTIDRKDWSAWAKDMDEYNFDMTWAAWGAGLFKDPESMWHSRHRDQPSGNNITGFSHPDVDEKIDSIKEEFDVEKRHDVVREIDAILAREVPYVLLWHTDIVRLLYWNKLGTPDHVLTKYGSEHAAESLWWADPGLAADLKAAKENGDKLPGKPARVVFDDVFPGAAEPLR